MYAVINLQWHQYIVNEWLELTVDKLEWNVWDKINIQEVLSVFDEEWKDVKVWNPTVKKALVEAEILEEKKWKKIRVLKFKRKTRYERNIWFRALQTVLKINKIKLDG